MNPNDRDPGSEQETGEPVRVLRDQERDTAPDFLARVRNRIHRRSATAQLATYSWQVPKIVLIEMASMLSHVFTSFGRNRRS
jgi:hypothetical protein